MTVFILVGLIPFAALGILLGHLLNVDSIGPAIGGITALFSFLGGIWFPITSGVHARHRAGAAVVLARAGEPRRARRQRLGHDAAGSSTASGPRRSPCSRVRAYRRDTGRV